MNKMNIKKDDTVLVISGTNEGEQGKVLVAYPDEKRVVVQNVNMVTRHKKPRKQGEQGGRIKQEGKLHISNVMLVCPHCKKPTRIGHAFAAGKGEGAKPRKVRACKKCGKNID